MNEKLILFKLLVHWILCQMLSDVPVVCSSVGIFNDLGEWPRGSGNTKIKLFGRALMTQFSCFYLLALIGLNLHSRPASFASHNLRPIMPQNDR